MIRLAIMLIGATVFLQTPKEKPLSCVAGMRNPVLAVWNYKEPEFEIPEIIWTDMLDITGKTIWIGYDNGGWDIPDDVVGSWKITGDNMEVWVWQSESAYKYYVFPFANTELFADSNGNHYGMHPCGAYEVDRRELNSHIINIINSNQ